MTEQERKRREQRTRYLDSGTNTNANPTGLSESEKKRREERTKYLTGDSRAHDFYAAGAQRRRTNIDSRSDEAKRAAADQQARQFIENNRGKETAYIGTGKNGSKNSSNYVVDKAYAPAPQNNSTQPVDINARNAARKSATKENQIKKFTNPGSSGQLPGDSRSQNTGVHVETDKSKSTAAQIADINKSVAENQFSESDIKRDNAIRRSRVRVTDEYTQKYNGMSADAKGLLAFINMEEETEEYAQWAGIASALSGMSGGTPAGQYSGSLTTSQEARKLLKELYGMTDDEIDAAVILHERARNAEIAAKNDDKARRFENEHPFISSVASVPMNVAGNVLSPFAVLDSYEDVAEAKRLGMGDIGLDRYNPYRSLNNNAASIRDEFTQTHDLMIGNYDAGDLLYNTAMSGADSLVAGLMGGTVGGAVLGLGAATETAQELSDRGIGTDKAVIGGLAAGVFEGLFERFSIGKFKALQENSADTAKAFIGNYVKSKIVNGSEEAATEIANILYDTLANGGLSQYELTVKGYIENGKSESEAKKLAKKELRNQVVESAISGMIMGGMFGVIGSVSGSVKSSIRQAELGNAIKSSGNAGAVIEAGKASTDAKIQKAAQNIKPNKNGEVSNRQVGKLAKNINSSLEAAEKSANDNRFYGFNNIEELDSVYNETVKKLNDTFGSNTVELKRRKAQIDKEYSQRKNIINMRDAAKNVTDKLVKAEGRTISEEDRFSITHPELNIEGGKAHINGQTVDGKSTQGEFKGVFEKDGEKYINTEDGREMKFSDAVEKITDGNIKRLWSEAAQMNTKAANLFIENYDGQDIGEYKSAFDYYHDLGRAGMNAEQIRAKDSIFGTYLTKQAQQNIANAGLASREFRSGVTDMSVAKSNRRFKYEKSVLEAVGKKFGTEFIILDESSETNAQYLMGTNRIVLYRNAEGKTMLRSVGHEVYHFVESEASEQAKKLESFVLKALEEKGVDIEKALAKYEKHQGEDGTKIYATRESRISELVADSMFDVFVDQKFADKLAEEDRTFAKKFAGQIGRIVDEIKKAIKAFATGNTRPEIKALMDDIETLDKIRDMLLEGYRKASENFKARESEQKNTAGEAVNSAKDINSISRDDIESVQSIGRKSLFSLSNSEINELATFAKRYYYEIGEKSPFFRAWFGDWREKDMTPIKIAQNKGTMHGKIQNIDTGWTINIPGKANNETKTHKSIVSRKAVDYLPYLNDIVKNAILLDSFGSDKGGESLMMHSLYAVADIGNGPEVLKLYVEELNNVNSNETIKRTYMLQNIEKQLGSVSSQNKSASLVAPTAINNISNLYYFVKQYDKNFSPTSSSKVVNADGTPKIMYHGSPNSFTAFDKKKAKASGLYGKGFYFTDSESHAGQYGDKYAVYLNIKNPLEPGKNNLTKKQLMNFLEAVAENGEDYDIWNYGTENIAEIADSVYKNDAFSVIQDVNATAIGDFAEAIKLFNEVNGTDYDGIITPSETVVYEPTQIKSATDNIGTFDGNNPDIRFSMKDSVEDNGELIAVHNISFENLLKSFELGGLAMPSIAVTKAKMGHSRFGNISLVFRKETIDPKANSDNRVYSSDAYTPTFPSVEYKANEKVHDKLSDTYYELYRKYGNEDTRPLYNYVYDINKKLKEADGDSEKIIKDLKNNKDLMNLYIRISGKERVEPIYREKVSRLSDTEIKLYDLFISAVGKDEISNISSMEFNQARKWGSDNLDRIKEAYKNMLTESEGISDEAAQSETDKMSVRELVTFAKDASRYLKRGAETVTKEYDAELTEKKIRETVDQKGFENWLHGLFDGIFEKKGIPNGKDPFTKSGNRKSFEALHWEYSLENIVEAMKRENGKGNALMGLPSIYGAASMEFDSIDDIRASKDKLKNINNEEFESKRKEFNERFFAIAESLCKYKNWETSNAVEQILVEALNKFNTRQGIESYVRKELKGFGNYNQDSMNSFFELVSDIKAMPTDYFEAKPERAVGFDEVEFAVIPDNTPQEIIDRLQELGIETREYKEGDENARTQALNSKPDILFSRKDPTAIDTYYAEVMRENRNLKQIITLLDDMQYSSARGNVHLNSSDINRIAGKILKNASSKYDRTQLSDELTVIYDYMANNKTAGGVNTEELIGMFMNISKRILDKSEMRDTELWEQYSEVREFLRGQAVYITPAVKKEIESQYGDYKTFRNLLMGKMNRISTTNSEAMTLDEVWKELSERAPEYFPEDTNELDMPMRLTAFYDSIAPKVVNPYEHYDANIEEACALLATDLYSEYFNVGRIKTDREKVRDILDDGMRQLAESKKKMKEDFRRKAAQNEQENYERYKTKVAEYKVQREQGDRRRRERAQLERNYNYINRRLVRETDKDHISENIKPLAEAFKGIIPDSSAKFSRTRFTEFENEYRKLDGVSPFFDEDMIDRISNLKDRLTQGLEIPRMRDISNSEVSALRDISEHIKHIVQGENRLFSENLKGTRDGYAQKMHAELAVKPESKNQGVGENSGYSDKLRNGVDKFIKGLTKPEYIFESLGKIGQNLYAEIRRGENTEAQILYNAKIAEQDIKRRNNYDGRWAHQIVTLKLRSGDISVTAEQAMALFATSKRQQGLEHMLNGGVALYTSNNEANGKKKASKRQNIIFTESDIVSLQNALTKDQKNYVNEMVEYITKEIGSKRNEVSMKLYGIEKYKEDYYFPIKVDKNFIDSTLGKQEVVSTIKNQSSSKRTVKKANNPIAITGFTETVNQHIYDSALYCAYVLPIEDFRSVFNHRSKEFEGYGVESLISRDISIKDDIRRACGANTVKEIEQFMVALDSGSRYENLMPLSGKLAARAKKTAVMANLSVVVQQPTAVFRAMLYVSPKYFANYASKADIEEMKQWNGCALKKEIGYFDVNMGRTATDYLNEYETAKTIKKDWSIKDRTQNGNFMMKLDQVTGWGASKADEMTWGAIWNACKKQIKAQNPELAGDALKSKAAELFQNTITKTQVYDSVFTKPEYMRRKEGFAMMATSFMSEPLTTLNMLADSVVKARNAKGTEQRKQALKFTSRAFACYVTSLVVNSAVKSFVYSLRDDDKDESYIEKYIANFTEGVVTDPFNMVPYLKDLVTLLQGYDLNRIDVSAFASFKDAIDALGNENKTPFEKIMAVLKAGGQASGIPFYNVVRDGKAIFNIFTSISDGLKNGFEPTTGKGVINELKETFDYLPFVDPEGKYDQLFNAREDGDERHYQKVYNNLIAEGRTDDTINSELASRLADNDIRIAAAYEATAGGKTIEASTKIGELKQAGFSEEVITKALNRYKNNLIKQLDDDSRVEQAAQARYKMNYDEYERLIDEMVADGYSEFIIKEAISKQKIALETEDKTFEINEKETYDASYDLKNAMINGNSSDVRRVHSELSAEVGKDKADEEVRKYAKEAYQDKKISAYQAEQYLTAYKKSDDDENDIYWEMEKLKGGDNYKKYNKLYNAVDSGNNLDGTIDYYISHGVSITSVRSEITSYYKPKLTSMTPGTAEYNEMYNNVIEAIVATGKTYSEAKKQVNKWAK
ncbi:MAG: hypothetical protein Q4B62_04065 [Clostridiaceae bacterium]|nr:hypothetical protein [Clostridiaceae bacterium]